MTGILIALIAQLIIGITLVIDKTFLKEKVAGNVFAYVFWIGIFNFFAIFAAPFDFVNPGLKVGILAFLAGVFFLMALIFYYQALQNGEASSTLAILGGFTPLATILISGFLTKSFLNPIDTFFFALLTIGGFIMFLADRKKFKDTIIWILLTAVCFAMVNVLQKISYDKSNFLTGFAIMKLGASVSAISLLLVPSWRKKIFERTKATPNRNKAIYLSNRAMTGIGSVMLSYAISLEHPALIEATSGFKYVSIFILTIILALYWPKVLKENFNRKVLTAKVIATSIIMMAICGLMVFKTLEQKPKQAFKKMTWGVSFSQKMSTSFGLNWRENYSAIINDLQPRGIRLMAYWDLVEPKENIWNFSDLDWQVDEAGKKNIPVIISVGQKLPRWPECHFPSWLDVNNTELREENLLIYEQKVIERYKDKDNLLYWQIENEPFVSFGTCPKPNKQLLYSEVALAHKIDSEHNVMLTDGGERGEWYNLVKNGDVFGSTLYRKVYNKNVGSIYFPLTPEFYELKKTIVSFIAHKKDQPFIISELGAEPWWSKQIYELPISQQKELLSINDIDQFTDFARRTNYNTVYLWGSEWWYYMKLHGDPSYWNHMKNTIKK